MRTNLFLRFLGHFSVVMESRFFAVGCRRKLSPHGRGRAANLGHQRLKECPLLVRSNRMIHLRGAMRCPPVVLAATSSMRIGRAPAQRSIEPMIFAVSTNDRRDVGSHSVVVCICLGALQTGWVFGSTSRNGVIKANQSGASLFPHFIHLQLERGRISGFVESIVRA